MVTFLGTGGYAGDKEYAARYLVAGQQYEVVGGTVYGYLSEFELKEFPGKFFNTVMFDRELLEFKHLMVRDY